MSNVLQGGIYRWPDVPENHPMGHKRRMWVVVSRDAFNEHADHVLACPLTSYPPTALDIAVKRTPHNLLDHDSSMLPRMITPILKSELGDALGQVSREPMQMILEKLRLILEVR